MRTVVPSVSGIKLSYAGRLDPMASGLLVVLHGDLLMQQESFWHLGKTYEALIALGVQSDSHDLLGMTDVVPGLHLAEERILDAVQSLVGKSDLPVPAYSSYRIGGRPLFAWARDNTPAQAPMRRMTVSKIAVQGMEYSNVRALAMDACERIALVSGDFRQQSIGERWKELSEKDGDREVVLVSLRIACTSGTYIRSLAHELGHRLGTGGVLAALRRTVVGPYTIEDPQVVRLSWPQ
jgi:tRNA pseudouridine55 synthase